MLYAILITLQLVQALVLYLHYRRHFAQAPLTRLHKRTIDDLGIYPDAENNRVLVAIQIGSRMQPVVAINLEEDLSSKTPHFYSIGVIRDVVRKELPPFEF